MSLAKSKLDLSLIFSLTIVFASLFFLSQKTFGADPNLQIDPSKTPRPACFTGWGESTFARSGGGIDEGECDRQYRNYGNQDSTFGTERILKYTNWPHCVFYFETRSRAICPILDSAVNFSVDKERPEENGNFTISWSSNKETNPDAQCSLSGKAPEKGNFSEETREGKRTYSFVQRGIYSFKFSCNGILNNVKSLDRGTIERTLTVFTGNIPPAPTVDIKIEPNSITKGESAVLSWTSSDTISLSLSQGIGIIPRQGSIKISPTATTRYTITGSGEFPELGLARKSVTLRVIAPEAKPGEAPIEAPPDEIAQPLKPEEKPKIDLKINGKDGPITVGSPANLTLSWNLNNYCVAYGSWIGIKTKAGSEQRTVTKPGTYNYKLYCPTIGSDEVTVKISGAGAAAIPLPTAEARASIDGKNFSQSIRVIRGEATQIWVGAAYDVNGDKKISGDETGKWTSLMSNGGRCEYNLDLNQGTPTFEGAIADPKTPEDCTASMGNFTFYDKPGVYRYGILRLVQNDGKISNVGYINIAVNEPPLPKGPPIIDLRINNIPGPAVTLGAPAEYDVSWTSQNADSCSASNSWDGDKFPSGYQHFVASEKKDFTYSLTCAGKLGTTTQSINLKVAELPVCDFSALPLVIDKASAFNRQSALSWKCKFANTCAISPAVGTVETFGTTRVSPKETTKYSLTCQNLDGSSSFEQVVEVK